MNMLRPSLPRPISGLEPPGPDGDNSGESCGRDRTFRRAGLIAPDARHAPVPILPFPHTKEHPS